jgi:hypothetical protein
LRISLILAICLNSLLFGAHAQTEPYGVIDTADLKMTSCDFEKDANAEVLFDKGVMNLDYGLNMERHTRVKIFNGGGERNANIRLVYPNSFGQKIVSDLEAETFNLENGKIQITPIDKKQILTEKIDKDFSAIVFLLPNVRPGSVIEYKYQTLQSRFWNFQGTLPVRYSEIENENLARAEMGFIDYVKQPFVKNTGKTTQTVQVKALANIHSLGNEPYMAAWEDNLQRVEFFRLSAKDSSLAEMANHLARNGVLKNQLIGTIAGESEIVKRAKSLASIEDKLSFLFDTARNCMTWNKVGGYYTYEGTRTAWDKRTGNSAEINIALYFLVNKTGIKAFPMLLSTRYFGRASVKNPDLNEFNNLVVYVPVDSTKFYVLDARDKYNLFNTIPYDDLNSNAISVDFERGKFDFIPIEDKAPVVQSVFINVIVAPDGNLKGNVDVTSDHYNKISAVEKYNVLGKEKYIELLTKQQTNVVISNLEMDDMNVDSLPLTQKIRFNYKQANTDANYIYLNTSSFSFMGENPFISEDRYSDIDFGFRSNLSLNCIYKLPAELKVDALPQSVTIKMPDQSIIFKRMVAQEDGAIIVRLTLDHKKAIYVSQEYPAIHDFYKKMYEMLNEQIVLKKSG